MSVKTELVQYGSHSSFVLKFETTIGPDTRVSIKEQDKECGLCWISDDDKDNFLKDFKKFLQKYYI